MNAQKLAQLVYDIRQFELTQSDLLCPDEMEKLRDARLMIQFVAGEIGFQEEWQSILTQMILADKEPTCTNHASTHPALAHA